MTQDELNRQFNERYDRVYEVIYGHRPGELDVPADWLPFGCFMSNWETMHIPGFGTLKISPPLPDC